MLFKNIIGQEKIKNILRNSADNNHIAHAISLFGQNGIGKFKLALAYLQYLNCQNPQNGDSCNQCPNCRMFNNFAHPNLHLIYPIVKPDNAKTVTCLDFFENFQKLLSEKDYFDLNDWINYLGTDNKQIRIFENESTQIAETISNPPYNKGYKGIIIWQPDKMNDVFANKILKMLEEPPQKTIFIFVGEHPELLLPTILSRIQTINVPPLTEQNIIQYFDNQLPQDKLQYVAKIAQGSILKAKKIINDDEQNQQFFNFFVNLMRNAWLVAIKKNYNALLNLKKWSLELAENKKGREYQKAFLQYAQSQIRENFISNFKQQQLIYQTQEEHNFSQNFAPFVHQNNVEQLMNELDKAETQIIQNGNPKIIFFDLCLQCIVLIKKKPTE